MQQKDSLSNFNLGILWFGAAVSLAEILTGALLAPLGLTKGLIAIVLGHLIGGVLFYGAGKIGAVTKQTAIESTSLSFGKQGAPFFALLNVIQLIGWTGVMIATGAAALNVVSMTWFKPLGPVVFSVIIALLICTWILIGFKRLSKVNFIAVCGLFVVSVILGVVAFTSNHPVESDYLPLSFGIALELSVVMPLSWLPLISDYTRLAKKPEKAALFSATGYFIGSVFMYTIGLGAALFAGTSDISLILMKAGLPIAALVIVLFSTVTTTFLDVYSAAISFKILKKIDEKVISIFICILGMLLAIFVPTSGYEKFLYLIGSAFSPLFAILLTDYYILKRSHASKQLDIQNTIIWCLGVIIYRLMTHLNTNLGSTLPTFISVMCIAWLVDQIKNKKGASR